VMVLCDVSVVDPVVGGEEGYDGEGIRGAYFVGEGDSWYIACALIVGLSRAEYYQPEEFRAGSSSS